MTYYPSMLLAVVVIGFLAIKYFNQTDIPKIKGLPEIPGIPIFGSLLKLGDSHARACAQLVPKYGPVFQVRLGNRRVIFANSFQAVKDLWVGHHAAMISRPTFWTFHRAVSKDSTFTLGTSPWNDSVKTVRKLASTAINRKAVQTYLPLIDLECTTSLKEILDNSVHGDINPNGYFQRFSLNISLRLNYGFRIKGSVQDKLLNEVVDVERELGLLRGSAHCWQDYIPILRLWPGYRAHARSLAGRRDEYILSFLDELKRRMENGTDNPCITGNVLKDPEGKLTDAQIKTCCLTMVAAGLDTLPSNINLMIAYLGSPHGQEIQARAYEELSKTYPDGDGWHACKEAEACEYLVSFIKEMLRYWSTLNLAFTRETVRPIEYKGAVIPAGTPMFLNTYAANHDPTHFKDPESFIPERFLGQETVGGGIQQMSYGAGARQCEGAHLANRQLYVIFTRIFLGFRIFETTDVSARPILDPIECSVDKTGLVSIPRPFKVKFVPRSRPQLEKWIHESLIATEQFDV